MGYIAELRELVGSRPLVMVGSCVIHVDEEDRLLMERRSDSGKWGLPGGALEPGETLEETARRELEEETGLVAENLQFLRMMSGPELFHRYPHGDEVYNVIAVFTTNGTSGTPRIDEMEATEIRYWPLNNLPTNLDPIDGQVIDEYLTSIGRPRMLEYLSGIDLCFPELEPVIEEWWRGHHPPGVPTHITILAPWRSPISDSDLVELRSVLAGHEPFDITFSRVARFDSGFIYLDPGPNAPLDRLVGDIRDAFPDTPPYGGTIPDPIPHLTIGKAPPGPELDELFESARARLADQLPVSVHVTTVTVLVSNDERWGVHTEIDLG